MSTQFESSCVGEPKSSSSHWGGSSFGGVGAAAGVGGGATSCCDDVAAGWSGFTRDVCVSEFAVVVAAGA